MIFEQTVSNELQPGDPEHDPNGPDVQLHELASGELLVTFSDSFTEKVGWAVGDKVVWNIDEETGQLSITCPAAEARRAAPAAE
jgi:hypothetical protein